MHITRTRAAATAAALLLLSGCAGTTEAATPTPDAETLDLVDFWVKESSLDLSAGFGTIRNAGSADDALVSASAEGVPTTQLHTTIDGVMSEVESMPIPAGGELVLAPMGNHLMFMELTAPIEPGDEVDLTLNFASGKSMELTAPVKAFTADTGHMDSETGADGMDEGHSN